ncbi:hypothetical protein [Ferrimicrobium sp.]|uniref:hypothetical protein n=1 Tax=Ferrimicrobium sp. TaxID=2926050 RepID=UPI0026016865|nr:hypothetical protein [Ferrimicrobium sp.]
MNIGQTVWISLASVFIVWLVVTQLCSDRLPTLKSIAFGFLDSWLGRALLLAGWAEMGWHLFCQHP